MSFGTSSIALFLTLGLLLIVLCNADYNEWTVQKELLYINSNANTNPPVTFDDQHIFIIDKSWHISKIDRSNGTVMWCTNPLNKSDADESEPLNLLLSTTTLLVLNGTEIWSIDLEDGSLVWHRTIANYYNSVLMGDKFTTVANGLDVMTIDAGTGAVLWQFAIPSKLDLNSVSASAADTIVITYTTFFVGTSQAIFYNATSGKQMQTIHNVSLCEASKVDRYLACLQKTHSDKDVPVVVLDTKAQQVVWNQTYGATPSTSHSVTVYQMSDLVFVARTTDFTRASTWFAAIKLDGNGAPLWNTSFIISGKVSGPTPTAAFGGDTFIVPGAKSTFAALFGAVSFFAVDAATGESKFSMTLPTNSEAHPLSIGNNLIFQNLMGWSRWTRNGSGNVTMEYHQLDQLEGVATIVAQGTNGYIVIAGSKVCKYSF